MTRGNRVIAAELKREAGRLSPKQIEWLAAFEETPVETFVWRPSSWTVIEAALK